MNLSPAASLLLWVACSIVVGATTHALASRSTALRSLASSGPGRLFAELALLLYHVGWPSLALFAGALGADLFGLGQIGVVDASLVMGFTLRDWLQHAVIGGLAALFVLAITWLASRSDSVNLLGNAPAEMPLALAWRDAIYTEFHWSFYRAPFILLLGDVYWGALAGLALILLARWGAGWSSLGRGPAGQFVQFCCALVSSLLCVVAHNVWLAIIAQCVIRRYVSRQLASAAPAALRSR